MKQSYDQALQAVLRYEGGYVNNPHDPGGATNRGVTQAVYDSYRARKGLPKQPVKACTMDETKDIYRNLYWNKVHGDDLPIGVDLAVFDFAVNSGPARAAKMLQHLVGVPVDGVIGPATVAAANAKQLGLTDALCNERARFLQTLPTFVHFGKGWMSRVENVRATAKAMRKVYSDSIPH